MTDDKTSRPDSVSEADAEQGDEGSTELSTNDKDEGGSESKSEGAKNAQHAVQQARERENEALKRARNAEKQLRAAKLSKMSKDDQYKARAEEAEEKLAKRDLSDLVDEELSAHGIKGKLAKLVKGAPWDIPPVAEALEGIDNPGWEDVKSAVQKHAPSYVRSLAAELKGSQEKSDESQKDQDDTEEAEDTQVDSERAVAPVRRKVYTRSEVDKIRKNPELFAKHKDAILRSMQNRGGTLPK